MKALRGMTIAVVVIVVGLMCLTGDVGLIEFPVHLAIGWGWYIVTILPQIRVNWETLLSTIVFVLLFTIGVHWLGGWLYRESGAGGADPPPRRWRVRWTLSGVAIVLLMFAAGTAAVGAVHQVVFLATSDQPMYERYNRADKVLCGSNLRAIGHALQHYAQQHGRYPATLAELVGNDRWQINRYVLLCPQVDDGGSRAQRSIPSYIYLAAGVTAPVEPDRIIACEPLANHDGDGMNILFGDGRVEFFNADDAVRLLDTPRR